MADQKLENLLNLALDATPQERERSPELEVGFEPTTRTWELIVKYSGNVERLRSETIQIETLSRGYAIVRLPETQIEVFSAQSEIEYIEKPKRLFFAAMQGKAASCINALQIEDIQIPGLERPLLGEGILVAVIDSGVDYTHPEFLNADGTTRILYYWDQSIPGSPPLGFETGTEYTKEQIDAALRSKTPLPSRDFSGHGTAVLGIAAGNGGVAPKSAILAVKLGNPLAEGFPRTTELMRALDYAYRKAEELRLPVAINLSFGTVYGPHNGTSLLETYISQLADRWKSIIVIGMGNEGEAAGHTSGVVGEGTLGRSLESRRNIGDAGGLNLPLRQEKRQVSMTEVELAVSPLETGLSVQLWKSYADEFDIALIHPGGEMIGPISEDLGTARYRIGGTELLVFYGKPSPYSVSQEIFFDFLPQKTYLDDGIWKFRFIPRKIVDGRYDMWLPGSAALGNRTRFYRPNPDNTLTIPASARGVVAVGAYDSARLSYAPFSGRGNSTVRPFPPGIFLQKPDLAAPGVDIRSAAVGGGYVSVTGTSFAAPFVTGAAAMLMQWGISDGKDPFLYGEKVRAYLIRGAQPLPGEERYPNPRVGYGALCVRESLPF